MKSQRRVRIDRRAGVATVTLDRPETLNAFDAAMAAEMVGAFQEVLADESTRAVVVTGAGRGFCAGADVRYLDACLAGDRLDDATALVAAGGTIVRLFRSAAVPVIAAVNGPAVGGGANLALACDVRFASSEARFGQVFANLGLVPDWGGTWLLPRLVGAAKATELFWTGELVGAEDALRLGLVSRVVPARRLVAEATAFAAALARKSRRALALAKTMAHASRERGLDEALVREEGAQRRLFQTAEVRGALAAFARRPRRRGRERRGGT